MTKKAYFIGIAGTTMANLAIAFKKLGWEVNGSDQKDVFPPVSTLLEENNILYFKGYSEGNLSFVPDMVVVGRSALMIDSNNPEYFKAKKLGCKILSYPEVISEYLVKKNSIVVAGTYGKSTTVSLITWILTNAGLNPSFMVGGIPLNFSDGARITNSIYSVVEGDETPALHEDDQPKFAYYKPKYLLLTATEYDHPEIYKSHKEYINAYVNLVKLLPDDGILFYDPLTVDERVVDACGCKKVEYFTRTEINLGNSHFESSLRSITLGNELKISRKIIEDSILSFRGLRGRQEFLGEFGGRFLYHDLSQQSSKVKGSLSVLKNLYPNSRIIVVFNPSATSMKYKESLGKYSDSFLNADRVIMAKVDYLSSISKENRVTGLDLIEAFGGSKKVFYEPISKSIIKWLTENTKAEDVIVFMSSGGLGFTELIEEVKGKLKGGFKGDSKGKKTIENKIKKNVSLADFTTYKIGGPADLFCEAETEEEIVEAINFAKKKNIAYFILGNGSKILAGDKGFRGLVIRIQNSKINPPAGGQNYNSKIKILAGAGAQMSILLDKCMEESLTGLEFMEGIPATVGGAIRGNAGAWQKNIGEKVLRVKVLTEGGEIVWIEQKDCGFAYRESFFKKTGMIILAVEFGLEEGDRGKIEETTKEYLNKRKSQPREPSVGCIFVNPKPQSAGELIEKCGLKGKRIGDAVISNVHANFIVNAGKASAEDVVSLIELAKAKVKEKYNIELIEEVVRVGEF